MTLLISSWYTGSTNHPSLFQWQSFPHFLQTFCSTSGRLTACAVRIPYWATIIILLQDSFNFTDSIFSYVSNYNISFYNSSSNVISTTSTYPVCDADICHYFFNMSSITCVEDQKLTISAINQLGQGSTTMITLGTECVIKQYFWCLTTVYNNHSRLFQ